MTTQPQYPPAPPGYGYQAPPQQQQYGYPPPQQQYGAPPVPQGPPPPPGSLDAFYAQPSTSSGPSWKFNNKPIGTKYRGIVARAITDADVRPQTNNQGVVARFNDGRPKYVMVVPMIVQPDQEFPDGKAGWWCKGQARDELTRVMQEAGCSAEQIARGPEAEAVIEVELIGSRPIPGMNPQLLYRVTYTRPANAATTSMGAQVAPGATQAAPPAQEYPQGQPAPQPPPQDQPAPPVGQPPPSQPTPAPSDGAGMSPEHQELLAKLTGRPQG